MRYDGRDNTKKLCDFISIMVVQKKLFFFLMGGGEGVGRIDMH